MVNLSQHLGEIRNRIVEVMLTAFEADKITEEQISIISAFVMDNIEGIVDNESLETFLHDLAVRWDIFRPLLVLEKSKLNEATEDEVAQGVLALAQYGKIDSAIKLAKSMTNNNISQ